MLLLILIATVFYPEKLFVLPKTAIESITLTSSFSDICLKMDGENALYRKIHPKVFVRKECSDSLIISSDSLHPTESLLRFDLNGDGKPETIRFRENVLTITSPRKRAEKYENVLSFVFYDIDNNGSLDLIYVDTDSVLHVFHNKSRIKNHAIVYSDKPYTLNYISNGTTYSINVIPYVFQGKIPLSNRKTVLIEYNGVTVPLKRGKVINLNKIKNPLKYVTYENDTLKLGISLSQKTNYSIEVIGNKTKNTFAKGTLPAGSYRFEYFAGSLKKGKYTVKIKLNDRVFTKEISVK